MWIEFVGIPGAGKSSVARSLTLELEQAGHICLQPGSFAHVSRSPIIQRGGRLLWAVIDLFWAVRLTCVNRRLWRYILPMVRTRPTLLRYWRLMRLWAGLRRIALEDQKRDEGRFLVLDQGLLQCLRSIFPDPISEASEIQLTRHAIAAMGDVLPDVVVLVVGVDESTAAARMRSRPFQRTSYDLDSRELAAALTPRKHYSEEVLPRVLMRTSLKVLTVDGRVAPEVNARHIVRRLCLLDPGNEVVA